MDRERLVLFDYGGVIAKNNLDEASERMCELFKVNRSELRKLLKEGAPPGQAFRKGEISEARFWELICSQAKVPRSDLPSDEELTTLWAKRYALCREMIELLATLRERYILGTLTNIDMARDRYLVEKVRIMDYVDVHYATWRFRATKQMPELWLKVKDSVSQQFPNLSAILYIDDRPEHVESALELGWMGIKFDDQEQLRRDMETLGFSSG